MKGSRKRIRNRKAKKSKKKYIGLGGGNTGILEKVYDILTEFFGKTKIKRKEFPEKVALCIEKFGLDRERFIEFLKNALNKKNGADFIKKTQTLFSEGAFPLKEKTIFIGEHFDDFYTTVKNLIGVKKKLIEGGHRSNVYDNEPVGLGITLCYISIGAMLVGIPASGIVGYALWNSTGQVSALVIVGAGALIYALQPDRSHERSHSYDGWL